MENDIQRLQHLIHREGEMVNHRMTWFLTLQGFWFAGLAFAWDKGATLSVIFCVVGALSSVSIGVLLRFGILASKRLEEELNTKVENEAVVGRRYNETSALIHFLLPWHFLPILFFGAWTTLSILRYSIA